jgi:acyl-[acyl carrier protein]--UDP-N-acetylglucosamine O-acyltransferase
MIYLTDAHDPSGWRGFKEGSTLLEKQLAKRRIVFEPGQVQFEGHVYLGDGVCIGIGSSICMNAVLEEDVQIGCYCRISNNAIIGKRTTIDNHANICNHVVIGTDCTILDCACLQEHVKVGHSSIMGHGVAMLEASRTGPHCNFGKSVIIGNRAYLESYVTLGDGSRVSDACQIGKGTEIAPYTIIWNNTTVEGGYKPVARSKAERNPLPIRIKGTRHVVQYWGINAISIGCHVHSFDFWLDKGRELAKRHNYTKEEIAEYRAYVRFIMKHHEKWCQEGEDVHNQEAGEGPA